MAYTKADIVAQIADRTGLTKVDSEAALNAFGDILIDALASGEDVKLTGLFSVERVERAARMGRNPQTGEPLEIAAKSGVKLTAGSLLKKAVA
jgi:DNA-binding protein HU-beta